MIKYITEDAEALYILRIIQEAVDSGELTSFEYDIEAGNYNDGFTGLDPITNVISLAQIGIDGNALVFDLIALDETTSRALFDLLEDDRVQKIIHNAAFEYTSHLSYGVKIQNYVCTMLAEKVIQAGLQDHGFSLADVASQRLGVELDKTEQKSDWLTRPLRPEQIEYAATDVLYLTQIFNQQLSEMDDKDRSIFELEMECLAVFCEMQYRGIEFNIKMAEKTHTEIEAGVEERLADLQKELPQVPLPKSAWRVRKDGTKALTKQFQAWPSGFKPVQGTSDIKIAMTQLIGEENMPKKSSKNSKGEWTKSICFDEKHRPLIEHPLMGQINMYCKWSGLWTKYIKNIMDWPHKITNRVHYRIDQLLKTGRISVSDPPVQQFPGRGQGGIIRECFVAEVYDLPEEKVLKGLERIYKDLKNA